MQHLRPYVLTIGGFDTSAGAGVLADIKTFEQLKVLGLSILTANTLQLESSFITVDWMPLDKILYSIEQLFGYYPISQVKIGIVPNVTYLRAIVDQIHHESSECQIIWDPVIASSTGRAIFATNGLDEGLLSKLYLVTPNYHEYQIMYGLLGESLFKATHVLLKGGHRNNALGEDVLYTDIQKTIMKPVEVVSWSKHGSGCVLSAAITAFLAQRCSLESACLSAKAYTLQVLKSNSSLLGFHQI